MDTDFFPVTLKPKYSITVNASGQGSVTCEPPRCCSPNRCTMGTIVTITATASQGWVFTGWTGDYTGDTSPASFPLNSNMVVTANFEQQQVIAQLNPPPASVYNENDPATGEPWEGGQTNAQVASISISNIGQVPGVLQWQCYAHANQTGETLLAEGSTGTVAPQGTTQQPVIVTLPNEEGTIQFGIKVRGESEEWPTWTQGLQTGKAHLWGQASFDLTPYLIG